jgi:hypothetical protein
MALKKSKLVYALRAEAQFPRTFMKKSNPDFNIVGAKAAASSLVEMPRVAQHGRSSGDVAGV